MDLQHVCPKCGSLLIFHENLDSYFCMECNEYYNASEFVQKEVNAFTGLYNVIHCKMCNRDTIISVNDKNDICPFCYNNLLDVTDGVFDFKPRFIIPFNETKQTFISKFAERVKAEGVPPEILSTLKVESLKGVYLPFYQYVTENKAACFMQTHEGSGRDDDFYYQMITYEEKDAVIVDTTRTISNEIMSRFANYNFNRLEMFFPKYLQDFYTLIPSFGGDAAYIELKKVISEKTREEALKYKTKSETIKELKVFNDLKTISRKVVLVPVWFLEYTLNNETQYLFTNGQTGKMASSIDFGTREKTGLFKKKEVDYQMKMYDRERIKREEFRGSLEYMNNLKKYEINKNDRSAEIRKTR